jgi:hypothetical protein
VLKKSVFAAMLSLLVAMSHSATAAGCYTARELEAEQGLRIHSELMVIGLTCMKAPGGGAGLYKKYQAFTRQNQSLIAQYESDIIAYYQRQGAPAAEKKLHTLRTNLANEISQHAISMSTASFCQHFGRRIDQALSMDQQKLRRWAQHVWPDSPTTVPLCRKI